MVGCGERRDDRRGILVSQPLQGEVWWAEADDKRRPVLVVTRSDTIPVLARLIVAPITRTIRGIPTEIPLGPNDGLSAECAASFDNVQPINRHLLTQRIATLNAARRHELCAALAALADC
jgi:mRNA interferase MazF